MSDFFQNGVITTFHRLGEVDVKRLEGELKDFSRRRPIALILPSLYREYASGALPGIMNILRRTEVDLKFRKGEFIKNHLLL